MILFAVWAHGAVGVSISGIGIERIEFGVIQTQANGGWTLRETRRIQLKPGTMIGWRIQLKAHRRVTWREEFILPGRPKTWGTAPRTTLAKGETVAVTEKTVLPRQGWIRNAWVITEGDPLGPYVLKVWIQGTPVKTFHFALEPP